ncbi:MAG: prepilin-type N-terminal cleavage/methylation domain-containing protein [Coprothermobacterota bacterium]|nr:prepilin-type N-terminal cleavage/methylation domain-containing protein [Coprothermobacterota bacterium]
MSGNTDEAEQAVKTSSRCTSVKKPKGVILPVCVEDHLQFCLRKRSSLKNHSPFLARPTAGFTLVEVIIAIALLALVLMFGQLLMKQALGTYQRADAAVSQEDQLLAIQNRIQVDLRVCQTASVSTPSASIQRLSFSTTGPITPSSTYYEDNATEKILYRSLAGVKNVLSKNNLVACSFTIVQSNSFSLEVRVELTSKESNNFTYTPTYSSSFTVNLRRYK